MENNKLYWKPTDTFEISGAELENLLKLGELFLIPSGNQNLDMQTKVYFKFNEAKSSILNRFIEEDKIKNEPVETKAEEV